VFKAAGLSARENSTSVSNAPINKRNDLIKGRKIAEAMQ